MRQYRGAACRLSPRGERGEAAGQPFLPAVNVQGTLDIRHPVSCLGAGAPPPPATSFLSLAAYTLRSHTLLLTQTHKGHTLRFLTASLACCAACPAACCALPSAAPAAFCRLSPALRSSSEEEPEAVARTDSWGHGQGEEGEEGDEGGGDVSMACACCLSCLTWQALKK